MCDESTPSSCDVLWPCDVIFSQVVDSPQQAPMSPGFRKRWSDVVSNLKTEIHLHRLLSMFTSLYASLWKWRHDPLLPEAVWHLAMAGRKKENIKLGYLSFGTVVTHPCPVHLMSSPQSLQISLRWKWSPPFGWGYRFNLCTQFTSPHSPTTHYFKFCICTLCTY